MQIDDWFKTIREKYSTHMQCGRGCAMCCHGLFDISLADAVGVAEGFAALSPDTQTQVLRRAETLQKSIDMHLMDRDNPRTDGVADSLAQPPGCPMPGSSHV